MITGIPLSDQVKAQLLPLPRWEARLEQLIERLPRTLVPVEMTPGNNIQVLDTHKGRYRAHSDAPHFILHLDPLFSQGGWYYLEAAVVRNTGSREAALMVETSDKTVYTIPIPTNLRGTVREVFFLPPNIRSLRWSPTAAAGYFSQSPLLIHRISPLESTLRRLYRVLFDLWRMRDRMKAIGPLPIRRQACSRLHNSYLLTANLRIKRLSGHDYPTFIALNDTLKKRDISTIHRQIAQWPMRPRISLIMALQHPHLGWLRETIDTLCAQLYPNWELLLAGNFTNHDELTQLIASYQGQKSSVRRVLVSSTADVATALNTALTAASGDYVVRIGQHDRLPPQALYLLIRETQDAPNCALVYSDEDELDHKGQRANPRFKPDWNPDLLTSCSYLGRLCLYRRDWMVKIGGYRSGFDGAEDYDLCLRSAQGLPEASIRHVPHIACHCRQPMETMTHTIAHCSGKRALEDFFADRGVNVGDGPAPRYYRIRYPLPEPLPLVSIIIPSRDQKDLLAACIDSIVRATTYGNWEILIVDNQTTEPSALAYLTSIQHDPRIRVLRYGASFNYAAINNTAVSHAHGEVLTLLNNDVEVISPDWLEEMVSHALRPGIGAVGAKLLYTNNTIQHAGVILGLGGIAGHGHKYLPDDAPGYCHRAVVTQNLSAVTGACLVVRRSVYAEVGGLDEAFAVAFNDVDFCLRLLKRGYRHVFTPHAKLYHHESLSRGHDDTPGKRAVFARESSLMQQRWGDILGHDRAYSPHLSTDFEGFSLKMR